MTAYHNWTHRPRSRGGTDPLEFGGHGPWIEPTLVNGYSDTTAAPDTFAYRHAPGSPDDAWEIEFRGHIEGPSDTYAFVLPAEDLPASDKYGITEGEDSDTGDGIVVEWYIEQATGFVFFTYPIAGGGGGGGGTAAEDVTVDSTTLVGTGTDVQAVLEELDNGIADHLADTTDAHDASAISFSPAGTIGATDVQAAIEEVASEAGASGAIKYKKTSQKQVTNTTSETDLFNGEFTVAANAMGATGMVRITAFGTCFQNSGSAKAFGRLRLKHGGTTIFDYAPGSTPWENNANVSGWWMEAFIVNDGATNVQNSGFKFMHEIISNTATGGLMTTGTGTWHVNTAAGGVAHQIVLASTTGSKDTTSAQTLEFTVALPTASTSVWMKLYSALIEVI